MVGIASYSVVLMVLVFWQPTGWQPMAWLIGVYIVNTAVTILINLSWKISVHLMGLSGALGAFVFFLHHPLPGYAHRLAWDSIYWGLFVLVPLLMWARVTVRAHTWAQTLGGAAYGFGATYGLLSWGWECYAG
jgi:membrane-associated phospholipid phosphatase